MVKKSSTLGLISIILLIIGGINLGLSIWDINLISTIFRIDWIITTAYALIGLSAVYELYQLIKK